MIRSVMIGSFTVILAVVLHFPLNAQAADPNWMDFQDVRFTQLKEFTDISQRPTVMSGSNRDCANRDLVIKPAKNNLLLPDQNEVKSSLCVVDTAFGTISGYTLQRPETAVAGTLALRTNKDFLLAANNMDSYVIADPTAPTGVYISFAGNLVFDTIANPDGTVRHFIKNPADIYNIQNTLNQRLTAIQETVAVSSNGKWMLFDSPNYGLVRLNPENGSILAFGTPTNYSQGFNPGYQTSISADGRYAVVSAQNILNIYDLNDCKAGTGAAAYLQNCKVRSLEEKRAANAPFGRFAAYVRFSTDDSITYYVAELRNGAITYRQYRITMGDMPLYGFEYLGLGDSFASGEGAFNYKNITDTDENKCHTSLLSYPYLIGAELSQEEYESVACSGAKTRDIYQNPSDNYDGQAKDGIIQKDRNLTEYLESLLPGKFTQHTIQEGVNPEAVTISVGGNDIAFADKITDCVSNLLDTTCFNTYEDRQEVISEINRLVPELVKTYQKLKEEKRRVYVIGYPKIINPSGNCANNVKLNNTEADFADKLTETLNDAIEAATKQAGVAYVNVENMLQGYRLCEIESKQAMVHGITQGNDSGLWRLKVIAKESFHPKANAHQLYRSEILSQTQNLTKPMPKADPTAKFIIPPSNSNFWAVQKTNRPVYYPHYQDIVSDRANIDTGNIAIRLDNTGLKPLSSGNIEIHSTPQIIGTYTADSEGNINTTVNLPESTVPGFHSLHIYGQTITGQNIDTYDYFFVGATDNDLDGDGILDENEGCLLIEPSGVDSDLDGVDDACDSVADPLPEIEDPPAEVPVEDPVEEVPEEVIPIPVFIPIEPPKIIGNDETVAGNEELVVEETPVAIAPDTTVATETSSTVPVQYAYSGFQGTALETNTPNNQSGQGVLGESDTQPDPATQKVLAENADGPQQTIKTNSKSSWNIYGWIIGAAIAFLALILVFILRKRRTA